MNDCFWPTILIDVAKLYGGFVPPLLPDTKNQRTSPMDESIGLPVTALEKSNFSIMD